MAESLVAKKAYAFALASVKAGQVLMTEKREFILSKQFIRSATSIGANTEEAVAASSRADFANKLNIALKEARETSYWLRLLNDASYLNQEEFEVLHAECLQLIKMLTSILITTRKQLASINS